MLLTSESANLGLLEGGMAVYVAQVEGPRMMRLFTEVGNRVPFYACATGKSLVAFQAQDVREALLLQSQLTRHTSTTITDREQLRLELAKRRSLTWIEAQASGRLGMVRAEPTALTYIQLSH